MPSWFESVLHCIKPVLLFGWIERQPRFSARRVLRLFLLGLWAIFQIKAAKAATYYLSPMGKNMNRGLSPASPWRSFDFAIGKLRPGDTLVLRDGTYPARSSAYPSIRCGANARNGTAAQPITLKAENERGALLKGSGDQFVLYVTRCSFWAFEGLRLQSADSGGSSQGQAILASESNHLSFRRLMLTNSNRLQNAALLELDDVSETLVEECEFYYFHRHGLATSGGRRNTFRRNYANSRRYADVPGYASGDPDRGDSAFVLYPGSEATVENNISEGNSVGFDVEAAGKADSNRFLGDISLDDSYGALIKARGKTRETTPHGTSLQHFVAVRPRVAGFYARSSSGTECVNCSVHRAGMSGFAADRDSDSPGDGSYSVFLTNCLVAGSRMFGLNLVEQATAVVDHCNFFRSGDNVAFSITQKRLNDTMSVDPKLGGCYVYIPDNSPMSRRGRNGAPLGAEILYRYQDGTLTSVPLWDVSTGRFPCGAVVPGVSDLPGLSCIDVSLRLNVNRNGCSLPNRRGLANPALRPTGMSR